MADRKVTVHLPGDCADKLTTIAEQEGRTLPGELMWLAVKRVQRRLGGSKVTRGKNDDEIKLAIRLPRELHDALREAAEAEDRTVSAEVRRLIRARLGREQAAAPVEVDPFTGQ